MKLIKSKKLTTFGMSKEYRIPLRKIRCMIATCYQKLKKICKGRG